MSDESILLIDALLRADGKFNEEWAISKVTGESTLIERLVKLGVLDDRSDFRPDLIEVMRAIDGLRLPPPHKAIIYMGIAADLDRVAAKLGMLK